MQNCNHKEEWSCRAKKFLDEEFASKQIANELYDFTWWATKDIIFENIRITDNMNIFEVGVGWGRIIHMLKTELPGLTINGIELTEELYNRAVALVKKNNFKSVSLYCGDILEFPFEKFLSKYNAIICIRVIHYISAKKKALKIMYDMLKKTGVIFISLPNIYCPLRWITYHRPLYPIFKLKSELESIGFKKVKVRFYNFRVPFVRIKGDNKVCHIIEKSLRNTPLLRFLGGLSYVIAEK